MKDTKVEVPAVAWWVLAGLVIPVLQVWIEQTFPGSVYVWAPLAVGALGAILKWISWVMQQNEQPTPFDGDSQAPARASLAVTVTDEKTDEQYFEDEVYLDWRKPRPAFDAAEFFFGIKRD